jgi:hypothetical protein
MDEAAAPSYENVLKKRLPIAAHLLQCFVTQANTGAEATTHKSIPLNAVEETLQNGSPHIVEKESSKSEAQPGVNGQPRCRGDQTWHFNACVHREGQRDPLLARRRVRCRAGESDALARSTPRDQRRSRIQG